VDRRAFFGTLAGGLLAAPISVAAQARTIPKIGVLWPNPPATFEWIRQGLQDLGYVEGRNINFEYRWAEGKLDELPQLATELVGLKVALIVTLAPPAAVAAKNATQTIPIVFVAIGDPIASGLVSSMGHPGGNLTGTTRMLTEMSAKHIQLLKEAVPSLSRVAVLWNPGNTSHGPAFQAAESTAQSLALQVLPFEVRRTGDLDRVFAALGTQLADGMLFIADPIFFINLKRMAELVAANRLPAVTNFTEFPRLGGLIGYAPNLQEEFRRAAIYVDKILRGAKAGDLPVLQPTKFDLVLNLKTAKALRLTIPPSLLQRADQVIE
jgi:putative tryptophan/tyrosine transport system substrate-binding protein